MNQLILLLKAVFFGVKLQLLHVLKGTPLADIYIKQPFELFTLDDYCDFVVDCIERLPKDMVIHRMTGDGHVLYLLHLFGAQIKNGFKHNQ